MRYQSSSLSNYMVKEILRVVCSDQKLSLTAKVAELEMKASVT